MIITSSLIFHLLADDYPIELHRQGLENIPVATPKLLINSLEKVDNLSGFYICADAKWLKKTASAGSVFLIKDQPHPYDLTNQCDAAFIQTELSLEDLHFEVCEICRKLQEWDLALKDAALDKTNISQMMAVANEFFPNPPSVVDRNYIVHGNPTYWTDLKMLQEFTPIDANKLKTPFSTVNELLLEPEFIESLHKEGSFIYHANQPDASLCKNIFANDQFLARIITSMAKPATPGFLYLFDHISKYLEYVFLNYTDDVIVRRQNDKIHLLLSDLIEKPETIEEKRLLDTLESYGWSQDHTFDVTVFYFTSLEELNHIYLYFCNQLEMDWLHSYAIKLEHEIIWVNNNNLCYSQHKGRSRRQSLSYLIRDLVCRAGVSNSFSDLTQLRRFYQQAVFAREKGAQKNPHFWYAYFQDYTLDYLLEHLNNDLDVSRLYHPGVIKLLIHDKKTGSSLTDLLHTYISSSFNVTTASDKLFIHRSTFNRQMKKIHEITGIDWHQETDPDELLHVLISLRQLYKPNLH